MIDAASTPQSPPLWPSVGALLIAGWLGGFAVSVLSAPLLGAHVLGGGFGLPGGLTAAALAPTLAGALVASAVLPRILRAFCEFELSLGAAFVVTLGSSLAGFAVLPFAWALFLARGAAVAPTSAMLFVLPQLVSLTVGYQLLKRLAHPVRGPRREDSAPIWPATKPSAASVPTTEWHQLLAGVRAEVAQILTLLARAEPKDVPAWVAEALTGLEALADRVDEAAPPDSSARDPQRALAAGLRQLQGALVDLSESAWRGDHRLELSRLRGLDEIEHALTQLGSVRPG